MSPFEQYEKNTFDSRKIIDNVSLTLFKKTDVYGMSNFSFDLSEMGDNPNLSDDDLIQKENKLLRAKMLIKTCLELTNAKLEGLRQ